MNAANSPGEAFFVAAEMERRAVRLYERALVVFEQSPCAKLIGEILLEEREHLARFSMFLGQTDFSLENAALLSAESAQIIFSGGLMEAHRLGAFQSPEGLIEYAIGQEKAAIKTYEGFAAHLPKGDEQAQAFTLIALEEKNHLNALEHQLHLAKVQKE